MAVSNDLIALMGQLGAGGAAFAASLDAVKGFPISEAMQEVIRMNQGMIVQAALNEQKKKEEEARKKKRLRGRVVGGIKGAVLGGGAGGGLAGILLGGGLGAALGDSGIGQLLSGLGGMKGLGFGGRSGVSPMTRQPSPPMPMGSLSKSLAPAASPASPSSASLFEPSQIRTIIDTEKGLRGQFVDIGGRPPRALSY